MKYKYEYLLRCWGGFWNEHNMKIHKEPNFEYKWFETEKDRDLEIRRLKNLEKSHGEYLKSLNQINDSCIVMSLTEGYLTRYQHIIEATVLNKGEIIKIQNNLGYGFFSDKELLTRDYDYMLDWKYGITSNLEDDHKLLHSTLILKK